ncbi:MAG TPA: ABC-2 family transporter protein, partial [Chloroflexota bacterium]
AVVAWGGYVVAAIVMIYALWFLSVSFTIWVGRINNIHFLVEPFMELARVPSDVYQGLLRVLFTFALPLAFVATVPTRALLGVFDPLFAGYGLALALGLLWLSHWWWNVALRRYASASS